MQHLRKRQPQHRNVVLLTAMSPEVCGPEVCGHGFAGAVPQFMLVQPRNRSKIAQLLLEEAQV